MDCHCQPVGCVDFCGHAHSSPHPQAYACAQARANTPRWVSHPRPPEAGGHTYAYLSGRGRCWLAPPRAGTQRTHPMLLTCLLPLLLTANPDPAAPLPPVAEVPVEKPPPQDKPPLHWALPPESAQPTTEGPGTSALPPPLPVSAFGLPEDGYQAMPPPSDAEQLADPILEHVMVETNGVRLHVVMSGPEDGPVVILLHGFPEMWFAWRRQIPWLARHGYRVWAPDQRGYNISDKPDTVAAYGLEYLAKDVVGLMDRFKVERAHLVGHDWGAAVAWFTAIRYPQRFERLVVINVPHPAVFTTELRNNPRQLLRSWYMFFFQIPWLPEFLLSRKDNAPLIAMVRDTANTGSFPPDVLVTWQSAWRQPGALTGMLNYYRAAARQPPSLEAPEVHVPTLVLWGTNDVALGADMAHASADLCDNGRVVLVKTATHWLAQDEPERVNDEILSFFHEDERRYNAPPALGVGGPALNAGTSGPESAPAFDPTSASESESESAPASEPEPAPASVLASEPESAPTSVPAFEPESAPASVPASEPESGPASAPASRPDSTSEAPPEP